MRKGFYSVRKSNQTKNVNIDLIPYADSVLSRMRAGCRPKTVYNCQTALRALLRYLESERPGLKGRLPVRCLTPDVIDSFRRYLLRRGLCENTIREYLRSLRSVVNRLIGSGLPLRGDLFSRVSTTAVAARSVTLCERDMRRIYNAPLRPGSREARARDLAVFSYLSGGIPYSDLARLKDCDYDASSNCLTFRRHKTGVAVSLRLTAEALRIWRRYYCAGGSYHFGLLSGTDGRDAERDYANSLACYNRALDRMARQCGVSTKVTSYAFRHAYASVARNEYDAPISIISASLGHRSERTTAIYISRVDNGKSLKIRQKMERGLTGSCGAPGGTKKSPPISNR